MIFAYRYDKQVWFRVGCRTAGYAEVRAAVESDYADSPLRFDYLVALDYLNNWGLRQLEEEKTP
jgi:hypothetical protein